MLSAMIVYSDWLIKGHIHVKNLSNHPHFCLEIFIMTTFLLAEFPFSWPEGFGAVS